MIDIPIRFQRALFNRNNSAFGIEKANPSSEDMIITSDADDGACSLFKEIDSFATHDGCGIIEANWQLDCTCRAPFVAMLALGGTTDITTELLFRTEIPTSEFSNRNYQLEIPESDFQN